MAKKLQIGCHGRGAARWIRQTWDELTAKW
jgi:hypothetical protein